ncbi:MAG TPA: hypothetical protein VMV31_09590, partial [Terriglobales bacterium]|nr:hypothetical protein [Terriglobales bacterium]
MIERGNGAGFCLEAGLEEFVGCLDGDSATEQGIAGAEHLAHATRAKAGFQMIAPESGPGREGGDGNGGGAFRLRLRIKVWLPLLVHAGALAVHDAECPIPMAQPQAREQRHWRFSLW